MLARLFPVLGIAVIVFGCPWFLDTNGSSAYAASTDGPHSGSPPTAHPIAGGPAQMQVPADLETPQAVQAGAHLFRENCVICHGAPGIAPSVQGLTPAPPNLLAAHRRNEPADLFHKVQNGIAGTAMPSFRGQLSDQSIWEIAGFLHHSRGIAVPAFTALSTTNATSQSE